VLSYYIAHYTEHITATALPYTLNIIQKLLLYNDNCFHLWEYCAPTHCI